MEGCRNVLSNVTPKITFKLLCTFTERSDVALFTGTAVRFSNGECLSMCARVREKEREHFELSKLGHVKSGAVFIYRGLDKWCVSLAVHTHTHACLSECHLLITALSLPKLL